MSAKPSTLNPKKARQLKVSGLGTGERPAERATQDIRRLLAGGPWGPQGFRV